MLITVKILKGGECTIEVSASTSISCVKELVAQQLQIPVGQQRLVFKGKTLLDTESLRDYNIVEGNKLHLFISDDAETSTDVLWERLQKFLEKHFSSSDAKKVVEEYKKTFSGKMQKLSLDDIERLAVSNLDSEASFSMNSSWSQSTANASV